MRWAFLSRPVASNGAHSVNTLVVPILCPSGNAARMRRPASAHARFMWCIDCSALSGRGPSRSSKIPPAIWPMTDSGSLKTIQFFTRSPNLTASCSANAAKSSMIPRRVQPPSSHSACGRSQWWTVSHGSIPRDRQPSTSRS